MRQPQDGEGSGDRLPGLPVHGSPGSQVPSARADWESCSVGHPGSEARPLLGDKGRLTPLVCGSWSCSPCFTANQQSNGHRSRGCGSPRRTRIQRALAWPSAPPTSPPLQCRVSCRTLSPWSVLPAAAPVHRHTASQEKELRRQEINTLPRKN